MNFWEHTNRGLAHGGVLRGHKVAVLCMATAGKLVFSGSADKSICVWRREEGGIHACLSVLTGHTGPLKCLAVEEDHQMSTETNRKWIVYSGSLDKSVKPKLSFLEKKGGGYSPFFYCIFFYNIYKKLLFLFFRFNPLFVLFYLLF